MRILKKAAALVMVCIMLVSMIPFAAFADHTHTWGQKTPTDWNEHECTESDCSETQAHTWVKQTDGSYKCSGCGLTCAHNSTTATDWTDGVCNDCGQVCNHTNGTKISGDNNQHTCNCCGKKVNHSDWVDQGNGNHKCGHCDYTQAHTWSSSTGTCTRCGAACTHTWDAATGICTTCGYKCKHTDDGGTWVHLSGDSSGEIYYCTKCGYNCGNAAHAHDWKNANGKCTVCGFEHDHSWSNGVCTKCQYTCEHPEHNEYGVCTKCGKTGIAHSYKNGVCTICGYGCPHTSVTDLNETYHKCDECDLEIKHSYTGSAEHKCTVCGHQNAITAHQFNNSGVCTICGEKAIAKVNGTSYASITEIQYEYNAATNPVLTLLQDIGTDSKSPIDTIIQLENNGTIDLNGHNLQAKVKVIGDVTLKNSSKSTVSKFSRPINFVDGEDVLFEVEGELTLPTPGTDEKGIEFDCVKMTAIKTKALVVKKDNETTIKNSNTGIHVVTGGSINVDAEAALTVSGINYSVLYEGVNVTDPEGNAIKGGTYSGTVSNNGKSTKFISGGTYSSVPNAYCIKGYGAPTDVKPYVVTKLTEINGKYVNIIVTAGTQKTIGSAPFDLTKGKITYEVENLVINPTKLGTQITGLTLKDNANLYINIIPIIEVKSFTEPDAAGLITVTYNIRLSATAKCGSTITVDPIECFTWGEKDMQIVLPYGIFDENLKVTHDLGGGSSEEFVTSPTGTQKRLERDDATQTVSLYVTKFSEFVLSGNGTVVCELTNGKANPTSADIRGYYENIEKAVEASTSASDTVVMLKDFPNNSDELNGEAKINLNGYDIGSLTVETGSITVLDTAEDEADWGTIAKNSGSGIGVQVNTDSSFKLESGIVYNSIKNFGNTTIAGGEVSGTIAIDNASGKSVLVVSSGKVDGTTGVAINTVADSVTSVSGDAEVVSANAAAICALGTLNVSGGSIMGTSAIELNSGSTTITDGVLTGTGTNTISCPSTASFDDLTITGGKFGSTGANIRVDEAKMEDNVNISGGIFTAEVKDTHCADDYVPGDNTDTTTKIAYPFTVKAKEYAATVTDSEGNLYGGNKGRYETLNEAIIAVPNGGTVTITKDLTENAVINKSGKNFTLDGNSKTCGDITVNDVNDVYIFGLSKAGDVIAYSGNVHIMSGKFGTHTLKSTKAKFIISGYPITAPTDFPYFMDKVGDSECYEGWKDSTDESKYQTEDSYLKYVPATSTLDVRKYTVALFNPSITATDPTNRYIYYKSSSTFSPNTVTIVTDGLEGNLLRNDKGALRCLKINDYYYDQYGNKYTYNSSTGKWTTSGTSTTLCYEAATNDDGNAYIVVYANGIVKFFNSTGTKNVQVGFVTGASNVAAFTVGSSVKTGDVNNVMVWIGVAVGAVVVFGGAAYIILKKNKRSAQ